MEYTQIIGTISPKSGTPEILGQMIDAGMDVVRLNFSHGSHEQHKEQLDIIRTVASEKGKEIVVLQDLSGPKIRTGNLKEEYVELVRGEKIRLTTEDIDGDEKRLSVLYPHFREDVEIGETIFLNDGKQHIKVLEFDGDDVVCEIIAGGKIRPRRGVNLPNTKLTIDAITEKDINDLPFGIENNVDWIALSFVKTAEEVIRLKEMIKELGGNQKVISKLETPQSMENIDEIIEASDAVMIARGDLAIEIGFEKVPHWQKEIIKKCNEVGKPAVVATQMLQSMISSVMPTRAEVSDVANAVLDGADAIMLSDETAVGDHPELSVLNMQKIIDESEKYRERQESVKM